MLASAVQGTRLHPPGMPGERSRSQPQVAPDSQNATEFPVRNCTTLAAAYDLVREARWTGGGVMLLNFASAKNPGGGFLGGARAQEESLARSSGLYPCIAPHQEMYDANRRCGSCLYTDHMIWSPDVPVFRDDEDRLLEEPYTVSMPPAPAVNDGAVRGDDRDSIDSVMWRRTLKVLAVAAEHGHSDLVLGAWGCGVFKNDVTKVAGWFHSALTDPVHFRNVFRKVVFAVLDRSAERRFIGPFEERFGPAQSATGAVTQ
jgi:uncharacterized protein (TIGR02452 family)